jgi:putative redox protein
MNEKIKKSEISFIYDGHFRVKCYQQDTHSLFNTDLPCQDGGRGLYSAPSDLLAAALGSSILTHLGKKGKELSIPLQGLTIHIQKTVDYTNGPEVKKLSVELSSPFPLSKEVITTLQNEAKKSPIAASLAPGIQIEYIFHWHTGGR